MKHARLRVSQKRNKINNLKI